MKWEFYEKDKGLVPIRTFQLYNLFQGGKWNWKKGNQVTVDDEIINQIFEHNIKHESLTKEFEELKRFLKEFLEKK